MKKENPKVVRLIVKKEDLAAALVDYKPLRGVAVYSDGTCEYDRSEGLLEKVDRVQGQFRVTFENGVVDVMVL